MMLGIAEVRCRNVSASLKTIVRHGGGGGRPGGKPSKQH